MKNESLSQVKGCGKAAGEKKQAAMKVGTTCWRGIKDTRNKRDLTLGLNAAKEYFFGIDVLAS